MKVALVVATPMYGGQCHAAYNVSVNRLRALIDGQGGRVGAIQVLNESLVNRARNSIVHQFLQLDATHLLFCDADQSFEAEDVMAMLQQDKPIIAAPVPMKGLNWSAIGRAARMGVADEDLHLYGGIFNLEHRHDDNGAWPIAWPRKIKRIGCAFMLIQRHVFENLANVLPTYEHDLLDGMGGQQVTEFFPTRVEEGRLMSEDYGFLNRWRELAGEVWLAPWVDITHFGNFAFTGSYKVSHDAQLA